MSFLNCSRRSGPGGKGRGASRGGRSDDGLGREMLSRGGYSVGRGGYHSGGGYRGGHGSSGSLGSSGGVDQVSHHYSSHQHHPTQPSVVTAVNPGIVTLTSKTPPAPEFEMKGNDFPALPGVAAAVTDIRKTSESEGTMPWESNR